MKGNEDRQEEDTIREETPAPFGGPTLTELRAALARHAPVLIDPGARGRAAVAAILHEERGRLRLLFIERATREGDPWSGHIAFPGGMAEPGEGDVAATVCRETREEIGLHLDHAECIGRLDDLMGRPVPIVVSALVYHLDHDEPVFARGDEVTDVFWVRVDELLDPTRRTSLTRVRDGAERELPAIRLPSRENGDPRGPERPVLWGLTWQLTASLLALTGRDLG